jgi:putative Mg2+ transporter-C (MgtC) family protein
MGQFWHSAVHVVSQDFAGFADPALLTQGLFRLFVAALLGAVLGFQREQTNQPAGLRTHMLVTIGAALFMLIIRQVGGDNDDLSRVMQGLVTGIGFLGAGAILKLDKELEVRGLTTAAGIWLATAIGMAVGLGQLHLALAATILAYIVLSVIRRIEKRMQSPAPPSGNVK